MKFEDWFDEKIQEWENEKKKYYNTKKLLKECWNKALEQREAKIEHGITCHKVEHVETGYLHNKNDDDPYNIDGCVYCGRCHVAI